jgi:hypothetical protein
MKDLTDADRGLLEQAAGFRCAGLDLRFEGGPWISDLDRLTTWGYLAYEVHGPDYMVSYLITEAGRAALSQREPSSNT